MIYLSKEEKRHLYLWLLEGAEALTLLTALIVFYIAGLNRAAYITVVAVMPFVFTVLEFYPTMDLFAKKMNISSTEKWQIAAFFADICFYIVCLFILR